MVLSSSHESAPLKFIRKQTAIPKIFCHALQRQSHLCIPFLGIGRFQSQFPHSCFCEWFIYSEERSTYFLQQNKQIHNAWEYMNRSQTHECGNWDCGRAILCWADLFLIFGIVSLHFGSNDSSLDNRRGWKILLYDVISGQKMFLPAPLPHT